MSHPLDNPIWAALTTRQQNISAGGALARRFAEDVSPLAAMRDYTPGSIAALSDLIPDGDDISIVCADPPAPMINHACTMSAPILQMIAPALTKGGAAPALEPLGDADAAEMLALATLTRPGPFRTKTHTLGRFLGIRDNGRLVAMAGERLNVDGFHEISAVCTHPDYRGRGYGAALMRAVGQRMLDEGDVCFLHTYVSNTTAIALYKTLGFTERFQLTHAVWTRSV